MQCNDERLPIVSARLRTMPSFQSLVTVLLSAALLAGCGHSDAEGSKSQVAARIDGKEITIHEVNQYLSRMEHVQGPPEQIRRRATDAVIDQNLLLQAAKRAKIDRDPDVLQSLLASNKDILIDAYLARQITQPSPPTAAAILAYYQAHPALFAERKLYQLDQLDIQANQEQQKNLLAALRDSATVEDFIKWLKTQRIPFDDIPTVKAPEDMSAQERAAFLTVKVGEATIMNQNPDGIGITVLTATQPQPLSLDNARIKISRILTAEARQKEIAMLIQTYRRQAKIEYVSRKD
ncbi:peptidyl-prolyl cis-trans isomerase, EpsD family [Sulfuriferula sp. AH1]|uniref:EpsD family peptidyl-prolyl cis-trans isomerase n=1 Tax=Sulfuriferula sp. AH1 TaxID=1985873 RepID=UPI000B3B1E4C|nr:EpsD family peptidyl-prolyl cis-trans isomerase [Sulfuriferula sp. AH1]ARU32541.1 peptidyl-prolyl cis-trans isomerase, EpsD family [Sulfuriferula sp. AH1]